MSSPVSCTTAFGAGRHSQPPVGSIVRRERQDRPADVPPMLARLATCRAVKGRAILDRDRRAID